MQFSTIFASKPTMLEFTALLTYTVQFIVSPQIQYSCSYYQLK